MIRRPAKAKAKRKPPLSRSLLDKMLRDLAERIDRQIVVAKAIIRSSTPNDQHVVIEYELRTAFGLMLDSQLRDLRDIQDLARLLCRDQVQS